MIGRYENSVRRMVRPKDVIGRYEKSVQRMIRPKDVIGRYEKSVRRMVRPKDVIGWYEKSVQRMVRPKDVIGRDEDVPYEECPKVRLKHYDWTRRRCLLKIVRRSVRRILIGRKRQLVLSSGTLLIGWSDGIVLLKRFWLADPIDLLSASSFDFFVLLVAQFHTAIRDWQETITRKCLLSATNTRSDLLLTR